MRTIITLAVGFWLARQLYIRHDTEKMIQKEAMIKKRLEDYFKENGFSPSQIEYSINEIMN